jgi:hypothetical protein
VIVAAVMGQILTNTISSIALTSVTTQLAEAFKISIFWVNMSTICSQMNYIPMNFLATHMYNKMRNFRVLTIGSFIMIVGAWVRLTSAIQD